MKFHFNGPCEMTSKNKNKQMAGAIQKQCTMCQHKHAHQVSGKFCVLLLRIAVALNCQQSFVF
jgi:hypothetical protein